MKNGILISALAILTFIGSCTKKTTVYKAYVPPDATLYGVWKLPQTSGIDSTISYLYFPKDGSNYFYQYMQDKFGYRIGSEGGVFNASNSQLIISSGGIFNYTVKNDTLTLFQSKNEKYILTKVPLSELDPSNFLVNLHAAKTYPSLLNNHYSGYSLGFDNDTIYLASNNYLYKWDMANRKALDSFYNNPRSFFYLKNTGLYQGVNGSDYLKKGSFSAPTSVSANKLVNVTTLSYNKTSNLLYAFQSTGELYSGSEGGTFSKVFDFSKQNTNGVFYYDEDTYLVLKDNQVHKVKVSPKFQVLESYYLEGYLIYNMSYHDHTLWVLAQNNFTNNSEFIKFDIP